MTATMQRKTGRSLVSDDLWERLVFNHTRVHHVEQGYAERVIDQALAFLDTVACTGERMSPSPIVDEGWHTFILHTMDYEAFTLAHYGWFVGHVPFGPTDGPDPDAIPATLAMMRERGYEIDEPLWEGVPDCTNNFQASWVAPCNHCSNHISDVLKVTPCGCHTLAEILEAVENTSADERTPVASRR